MGNKFKDSKFSISVPGLMYAFWCFVLGIGFLLLSEFLKPHSDFVQMLVILTGFSFCAETVLLLFFAPVVKIQNGKVICEGWRPSIWLSSSHIFMMPYTSKRVEEFPLESFENIQLDYTRVPVPLPIPFLKEYMFSVYRWMVALETAEGESVLLAVAGSADALEIFLQKLEEKTGLPVVTPRKHGQSDNDLEWNEDQFRKKLFERENWQEGESIPVSSGEGNLSIFFGVNARDSNRWIKIIGYVFVMLMFGIMTMAGFLSASRSTDVLPGLIGMVSGVFGLGICFFGLRRLLKPYHTVLNVDKNSMVMDYGTGFSDQMLLKDIVAVSGSQTNTVIAETYGLGKEVPCIDIFSTRGWLHVPSLTENEFMFLKELLSEKNHENSSFIQ